MAISTNRPYRPSPCEVRCSRPVPSDDADAMAQALVRMATDPARAAAMGRAGRAEVERRFSLRAMVAAYQGLYSRELAAVRRAL